MWTCADLRAALEKRAQSLGETGTTHSLPSFLSYPLRMKFLEGSSVQGRQWNCFLAIFLCHLVHTDPALSPIRILLELRPFHSSDRQSYLHLQFLPYKKWPKGEPHLDSCSRPGRVSPGVRASQVTWGLGSEGILWEYRLGSARWLSGRSRRCRRWDPLRPRPWR